MILSFRDAGEACLCVAASCFKNSRDQIIRTCASANNCQVAVSLSLANHHASLPAMYRLYLPQEWAADKKRRRKAGVPKEISFKTKPEIALEQIEAACRAGLARGVVLMDAGYGCNTDLRTSISALGLTYVAGILPNTHGVDIRHGAAAAEKMVGQRATAKAAAPRPPPSNGIRSIWPG
jgi:SRSO17 transposase